MRAWPWLAVVCACGSTLPPPHAPKGAIVDAAAAPGKIERFTKVVAHGDRLWLRGVRGTLVAFDPATRAAVAHLSGESVRDVRITDAGELWALTRDADDVRVWKRETDRWIARFQSAGDEPLALAEASGAPVVLTSRAILRPSGRLALDREMKLGHVKQAQFEVAGGLAYVGMNSGEFGGALYRVDLGSGGVEALSNVDGTLCGGVYNPACDPVTGIVADPSHPSCVLVGVGLRHFFESGRLLRVCDRTITVAWRAPTESRSDGEVVMEPLLRPPEERAVTICLIDPSACPKGDSAPRPFREATQGVFGLTRVSASVWMATGAGVYSVTASGVEPRRLGEPSKMGSFAVADVPGAWIVWTDANWAASLSGYTPLVAPKGPAPPIPRASPIGRCFRVHLEEGAASICFERDRWTADVGGRRTSGPAAWTGATLIAKVGPDAEARFVFQQSGDAFVVTRDESSATLFAP